VFDVGATKQHHREVLLRSLHLNGSTAGFQGQIQPHSKYGMERRNKADNLNLVIDTVLL